MLNINNSFVNVLSFRNKILEFSHTNDVNNSLSVVNPKLAEEWNYEKNGNLKPTMFTRGSNEKVWWKCSTCGHEWQSLINNRSKGQGCPKCKRKKISMSLSLPKEGQSLQDKNPELTNEWNYKMNGSLSPLQVKCGSNKKVWWKCNKCGHVWQATVNDRSHGYGCPECGKKKISLKRFLPKEGQSLQDKNPELANEWNYKMNGGLSPLQVKCGSNRKVWWKCSICGYEWQAMVNHRSNGRGCPECAKLKRKKK